MKNIKLVIVMVIVSVPACIAVLLAYPFMLLCALAGEKEAVAALCDAVGDNLADKIKEVTQ